MKFDTQKYFQNSTIDGFSYVSREYNIVERVFWGISLLCSAICTLILISKFLIKVSDFPIVVYLSDKAVPLSEVNFPAVTFCPDFLPYLAYRFKSKKRLQVRFEKHSGKEIFYEPLESSNDTAEERAIDKRYTEILDGIVSGEIDHRKLGLKILQRLQVVDIITNRGTFARLNFSIPNDNFLDVINNFYKQVFLHDEVLNVLWIRNDGQFISEILTSFGLCYTFNMAFASDLLHMNSTSDDFHYKLLTLKIITRSNDKPPQSLPRNISSSFTGLQMNFKVLRNDFEEVYQENYHGLTVFIHDPFELPSKNSRIFNINVNERTKLIVDAELYTTDDSIIDFDPKDRDCYFDSEKRLKFFKKYTKPNCLQECLTDFMINSCGCAEFFMIRNSTTRICSANEEKCYATARSHFKESQESCDCLRPCSYTKYNLELNKMEIKKYKYTSTMKSMDMSMNFKKDSINHFIYKKQYDTIDFLSYSGGLLGLLAGFSFLSFVELIYWFIIRVAIKTYHRSTRVRPFNEGQGDQERSKSIKNVAKDFLKRSSIHGMAYILKNNIFDKIFWGILMVGSAILGFILISKTREKIPDGQVISYDDSFKDSGNIIFPAVTVIPAVPILIKYYRTFMDFKKINGESQKKLLTNETFKLEATRTFSQMCLCLDNCIAATYWGKESNHDFSPDAKEMIQNESKIAWFKEQFALLNKNIQPVFAEIRTYFSMSYTFNIIDADKLLNFNSINSEFWYSKNITTKQQENYFQMAKNISVKKGFEAFLEMRFENLKVNKTEVVCKNLGILVHETDALPTFIDKNEIINIDSSILDIEVIPEVIKSDEEMKFIHFNIRKCYFEGEKSLKFFNKYSEKNCIIECLTNFTLNMCNCSDVSQPFEKENFCTRNSYDRNEYCPSKAIIKFHSDENSQNHCGCMPTCDSVRYHVQYFNKFASDRNESEVKINVRLNTEDAILFRRYQQFTFSDVVSYVGGLLGLLAGISVLSIVEFFYFFVVRVLMDFCRSQGS